MMKGGDVVFWGCYVVGIWFVIRVVVLVGCFCLGCLVVSLRVMVCCGCVVSCCLIWLS